MPRRGPQLSEKNLSRIVTFLSMMITDKTANGETQRGTWLSLGQIPPQPQTPWFQPVYHLLLRGIQSLVVSPVAGEPEARVALIAIVEMFRATTPVMCYADSAGGCTLCRRRCSGLHRPFHRDPNRHYGSHKALRVETVVSNDTIV